MATESEESAPTPDDVLAAVLATGKTYRDAGERIGVSETTVWRRMQDPTFRQRVAGIRRHMIGVALNQIAAAVTDAVAALHLAVTDAEDASVRVRAADILMDYVLKFEERHTLEERLARVEAYIGQAEGTN